jgi:uncharacterized protein (TIGR03435 family)
MMPAMREMILAASGAPAAWLMVKATVAVALGLLGATAARRSRASVRHTVLAAMFGVLLLLPVVSVVAPPMPIAMATVKQSQTASSTPAAIGSGTDVNRHDDLASGAGPAQPRGPLAQLPHFSLMGVLLAVWMAGAALCLLPMAVGFWQVRSLRRSGLPWLQGQRTVAPLASDAGIQRRIDVLLHEALPGPMTCGAARPAIVLPADAENWDRGELNRAMVHELEHVRRGDWLSQCLARVVCAAYWFHPLVWMAWRQLTLEAERACDDAVLDRTDATVYADQLVGLAQRLSLAARGGATKSPLLAMANRADLAARVGAVLDGRQPRGRAGRLAVVSCMAAAALVLALSPLRMVAAPQAKEVAREAVQAPQQPKPAAPAAESTEQPVQFEAVSVKLLDRNLQGYHSHENNDPGRLSVQNTVHQLLLRCYGITEAQLSGEPDWFRKYQYSIEAVTGKPTPPERMMVMLRGVLAERFQLKLREEKRDMPVYLLEVAPGGPKFKERKPDDPIGDDNEPDGFFARSFGSIQALLDTLNRVYGGRLSLDRPVLDGTHLTGLYTMHLETMIETERDALGTRTLSFPNLFHDLQSQLGLRLVAQRAPLPAYVVEHAVPASEN